MESLNFDTIFRQYQSKVYSIALRYTGDRDSALEVAQETFISIYKNLESFRGQSKISTWIYRIAVNQALSHKRSQRVFEDLPDIDDIQTYFGGISNAIETMGLDDRKKYIAEALERLHPDESTILTLYYLEEQSIDEVSTVMSLSPSNVKVKLFRSRARFYDALKRILNVEVNELL